MEIFVPFTDFSFLSYFFCKKIPLSRRVGCVMDGLIMVQWISGSSERCMYVTPIRLDLP